MCNMLQPRALAEIRRLTIRLRRRVHYRGYRRRLNELRDLAKLEPVLRVLSLQRIDFCCEDKIV